MGHLRIKEKNASDWVLDTQVYPKGYLLLESDSGAWKFANGISKFSDIEWTWDDLKFPSQGINPPGAVSDPGLESTTGLWLFDATGTETLAGIAQMPHAWREGSTIKPHVHWQKTTSAAGDVLWQFEYEVVNNGDTAAMDYGTVLTSSTVVDGTPDGDTANELLITSLGDIDMTDKRISCIIFWKLSRVGGDAADTYGADARLLEFDIHYQSDSKGSIQEFIK